MCDNFQKYQTATNQSKIQDRVMLYQKAKKKQPLTDIICMRTIIKPRCTIQNQINKEQTGLDISYSVDGKYYERKYGYHLCECCDIVRMV